MGILGFVYFYPSIPSTHSLITTTTNNNVLNSRNGIEKGDNSVIKGHEDYTKNSDERLIASAQSCKKTDRIIEKQEANNGKGNN